MPSEYEVELNGFIEAVGRCATVSFGRPMGLFVLVYDVDNPQVGTISNLTDKDAERLLSEYLARLKSGQSMFETIGHG